MPEIAVGVQLHHLRCSFVHLLDRSFDMMVFLTSEVDHVFLTSELDHVSEPGGRAMTKARCWRTWGRELARRRD